MLEKVSTHSQGTETWKKVTEHMHITAYCPVYEQVAVENVTKEPERDDAAFGTHIREAIRVIRGR